MRDALYVGVVVLCVITSIFYFKHNFAYICWFPIKLTGHLESYYNLTIVSYYRNLSLI